MEVLAVAYFPIGLWSYPVDPRQASIGGQPCSFWLKASSLGCLQTWCMLRQCIFLCQEERLLTALQEKETQQPQTGHRKGKPVFGLCVGFVFFGCTPLQIGARNPNKGIPPKEISRKPCWCLGFHSREVSSRPSLRRYGQVNDAKEQAFAFCFVWSVSVAAALEEKVSLAFCWGTGTEVYVWRR